MHRREMFRALAGLSLAALPIAAVEKPEEKVTEIKLPYSVPAGTMMTVVNTGPGWLIVR